MTEEEFKVHDYNWYKGLLEDINLLDKAIWTPCGYAVPVGGNRKSGEIEVLIELIPVMNKMLSEHPQLYPNLRIVQHDGYMQMVWGDDYNTTRIARSSLEGCVIAISMGLNFGYKKDEIKKFAIKHFGDKVFEQACKKIAYQ